MSDKRFEKKKWGWWASLIDKQHFKVKLLRFNPQESCSRQKHKHRNELWLWLSGQGIMEVSEGVHAQKFTGDYHFVPVGGLHKYMATKKTLVLEIQYGESCREEDIVRL